MISKKAKQNNKTESLHGILQISTNGWGGDHVNLKKLCKNFYQKNYFYSFFSLSLSQNHFHFEWDTLFFNEGWNCLFGMLLSTHYQLNSSRFVRVNVCVCVWVKFLRYDSCMLTCRQLCYTQLFTFLNQFSFSIFFFVLLLFLLLSLHTFSHPQKIAIYKQNNVFIYDALCSLFRFFSYHGCNINCTMCQSNWQRV